LSNDTSIISRRYNKLAYPNFFNRENFVKQHQWMCLTRDTVKFFLVNNFMHIFGNCSKVPDEHYFINIMNKYNIGYDNIMITFVNWEKSGDHPTTYTILTPSVLQELRSKGSLFARKISKDCVITENTFNT